jgi:Pyridine nucleotide-disulphide oxidoreductase
VGAGAGGIELALALAARARHTNAPVQVTLVEAERQLPARNGGRDVLVRLLAGAGVRCIFGARVVGVTADAVQLDGGRVLDAALTIWVAETASPEALQASSSLPLTHDGFLRVNASLQAVDGAPVFGAGDCVAIEGQALDKAGVYAVRQAPILARNLRTAIATQLGGAGTLRVYRPQRRYLSILDTSDGQALLTWGGWAYHTKWALPVKRWLDARFVARYRPPDHGGDTRVPPNAPRLARLRSIASAFAAGAATVLVVHQPLVWSAHRWVDTPWVAFSTAATRPFGIPALLSAMAWGGAWVALLSRWWRAGRRSSVHRPAEGGGISTLAAAISCALIPTAVGAILTSGGTTFPPLGEHPWRAAVAALVINGAWGWSAGALLSAWRSRGAVASRPGAAEGGPAP